MLEGFLGMGGATGGIAFVGDINGGFQMHNAFAGMGIGFGFL